MLVPQKAVDLYEQGYGTDEVVRQQVITSLGTPVSIRQAQEWRKAWKEHRAEPYGPSIVRSEIEGTEDVTKLQATADQIMSLEDLIDTCGVDLETWKVDKYQISTSEKGNVKAWFSRRQDRPFLEAAELILNKVKNYAPEYKEHNKLSYKGEYLFAPQVYDPHFNKRSVDSKYGVKEAVIDFRAVGDALIGRVLSLGMSIDRIVLPVGNDALHADNLAGTTTRGTEVELMIDQREAINEMCQAYIYFIERLVTVAPVDVIIVAGNHDRYSTHWLGKVLEAWFHNHSLITVDTDYAPRKYYRYHNNFFCMEHGEIININRLAGIIASEAPVGFALSQYKEVWRGHLHLDKGAYIPFTEENGLAVRTLPSLCKTDDWHRLHGFVGNRRAAEALLYHADNGPAGNFPVFIDELY